MISSMIDKLDQLLERNKPPKVTHKEIHQFNRSVSIQEITSINYNFSKQKVSGPDSFNGKFYRTLNRRNDINSLESLSEK